MRADKAVIQDNLERIRERIASAADRAGRDVRRIGLVAVTKTVDVETVGTLLELGLRDFGESRAQQLVSRAARLAQADRPAPDAGPRWHMIGHLQRNKIRSLLPARPILHSVDSLRLAEDLNARAEKARQTVDVFLQVNCSQEPQKFGCAVGAAAHLGAMITTLKHLRLLGLMTMAEFTDDPETTRPTFARLRELFEEMRHDDVGGEAFRHLSMGMSQDYPVAVEEGATVLRIGTALFERP